MSKANKKSAYTSETPVQQEEQTVETETVEEEKQVVEPTKVVETVDVESDADLFGTTEETPKFRLPDPEILPVEDCHAVSQEATLPRFKKKTKVLGPEYNDSAILSVRGTAKSVYAVLERLSANKATEQMFADDPTAIDWLHLLESAQYSFMVPNDQLYEATVRNGSMWVNQVNYGTEKEPQYKGLVSDRKGLNPNNKSDTRAISLVKALTVLNMGMPAYVPLYQTGIWLKLRTPTAAAFARLDEAIVNEKIQHGTITHGNIFSNDSILLRKHVANFILEHVEYTNAPSQDIDYLKSIIKDMDLDIMMLGCMLTRYTEGYQYAQICTVNPQECRHIEEGLIDLRTLAHTDESRLTEFQKRIMSNPRRGVTEEDLKRYQDEFKLNSKSRIVVTTEGSRLAGDDEPVLNGIAINVEPPTLEKAEEYGLAWIRELERIVENVLREKHSEEERRRRMSEEVIVNFFKTYGQWVKSISIYEAGQMIREVTDNDELNELFGYLSSDSTYVTIFRNEIRNYINNNIITVCGTLNYECPKCGKKHDTPEGSHYIVLPMDMLFTFFTLTRYTVTRSILPNTTSDQ